MSAGEAVATSAIGGRLWFYTNYHCNLACRYCLTESKPDAQRRELEVATILRAADDAVALGFTAFGVTGGEPFLEPLMPNLLTELGRRLPTVVLTNGTLFTPRLLDALAPLANLPVALQISLDDADPFVNDAQRGGGNFAKVVAAIPVLRAHGLGVRIGSTVDGTTPEALERLCELHRSLGIADVDHVVRPIVRRGRAAEHGLGIAVEREDLPAELTLTAQGAYWSPAAPTVQGGVLDIDYLLTRTLLPLAIPVAAMLRVATTQPLAEPALRVT